MMQVVAIIRKHKLLAVGLLGALYGFFGLPVCIITGMFLQEEVNISLFNELVNLILVSITFPPAFTGFVIWFSLTIFVCNGGVCRGLMDYVLVLILNAILWSIFAIKLKLAFFKPNKLKILVFLVFIVFFFKIINSSLGFANPPKGVVCYMVICTPNPGYDAIILGPLILLLMKVRCCDLYLDKSDSLKLTVALLLALVYWWALSCFIANMMEFIYKKIMALTRIKQ